MNLGTRLHRFGLYARTVAHIPPAQVAHRLRLRARKAVLAQRPDHLRRRWELAQPTGAWPADFMPLDADLADGGPTPVELEAGRFTFLNHALDLGEPIDWTPRDAPQLWRYHLHYWEWAWALAQHGDRSEAQEQFAKLWLSWREGTTFGSWDEWSPYVVSLRTWVLCGLYGPLISGTPIAEQLRDDIRLHLEFVVRNLELDVGGNHLIKNLKALIGGAAFCDDRPRLEQGRRLLQHQLRVQVLDDGGHFERSPSYHAQVLGDLLDIAGLLAAAGEEPVQDLDESIAAMRQWLSSLLMPDGEVPVLNDAAYVGRHRLEALDVRPAHRDGLALLATSGYAVLRSERLHLVADVGPPCPPELPAHAQADCLTFELAVDGARIVVDPGTSTYEPGTQRAWERSTRAHNTVAVDGADQTEVWGTFRAARLARPQLEETDEQAGVLVLRASHDGYERLAGRPRHRRTWRLSDRTLVIEDEVTGSGRHLLVGRLQFAPGVEVTVDGLTGWAGPVSISFEVPDDGARSSTVTLERTGVATDFGPPRPATAVDFTIDGPLPVVWRTTIEVADREDR